MNKRNIPVGVSDFSEIRQKNESLFQGLAVSSDSSLCKEWMNQWPVVFLSRDMLPPLKSYDFEVGASCSIAF